MAQQINSFAETKAQECLGYSFCSGLNLLSTKERLGTMLNHIGDNGMFAEYTMHDISHVNGMLALLDKIIPDTTKYEMTHADWLITVLAVYFHDLGMLIPTAEYDARSSNTEFTSFRDKMLAKDKIRQYVESLSEEKGEKFLYQEYVRKYHGERICEWITNCDRKTEEPYKMINEMLGCLDASFRKDLAQVCLSHQLDNLPDHLKSVDEAYGATPQEKANLLYASVLLRSSDILHMTHDRTPDDEYRIISPQNQISVIEWAKQKAVKSIDVRYEKDESGKVDKSKPVFSFAVQAKFTDDKGYFSFKEQIAYAIDELKRCHEWCEDSRSINANQYYFPWKHIDTERVVAEGFSKEKLRFEIDQQNILKLLTGHTLYNDSTVVIRELVQNAMDAGKLQDTIEKAGSSYQCRVEISWDSNTRILRVADNATGMNSESISNYLLKVGASKYQSETFKKNFPDFHSISRFGIGLLTCFMISDDVDIYTLDADEKQCHLLKIRNLNGEYLMRNDADTSNILDRVHGTTFELKVRAEIDMSDIEAQVRQWIMVPFGQVTLSIDGKTPVNIGSTSVKAAIEQFTQRLNGVDLGNGNFKVVEKEKNGISMAFLLRLNPVLKIWSLYSYKESEYIPDAPMGICVEGVRVTSYTPGQDGRNFLVLANCTGKTAPTTNVARNDLEGGALLEEMYKSIYEMYIDLFTSQFPELMKKYSLTWAVADVNHMIDVFNSERSFRRIERRDILGEVMRKAECNALDDGREIKLRSLEQMPSKALTFDSMAFTSAVSLLKDMNLADKTAYGLLTELEKSELSADPVLLDESMANSINKLFLEDYEVSVINVDENVRKIKFTWEKQNGRWYHIKVSHRYPSLSHLYIIANDDSVSVEGMGEKSVIVSGRKIFIVKDSVLLRFLRNLIAACTLDDDAIEIVSDLLCQLVFEHISGEQAIDRFVSSDENFLKKDLFEKFTLDELKGALKGCNEQVVNIKKYYQNR